MNTQYIEHEEQVEGLTIKLIPDENYESPREWENIGTMICWHSRYNLGDKHSYADPQTFLYSIARERATSEELSWLDRAENLEYNASRCRARKLQDAINSKVKEIIKREYVMLELYLYDHSGITMSCSSFSDPWDSGQVGFIYCTLEKARKELMPADSDEALRNLAREALESEVKTYDSYLTGDVVGYVVEGEDGEHLDSCWGFFPDNNVPYNKRWEYPLSEARDMAKYHVEKRKELEIQLCANI
jgi:hypothetical protein